MHFDRLGRGELVAATGGLLLAFCLFLPWYETDPGNANATIDGTSGAISPQAGYVGALLGTILMIAGGAISAGESERERKPPGVL